MFAPTSILCSLIVTAVIPAPVRAPDPPLPVRRLAPGVFAVLGDIGRGSEGRPNAGFIVTGAGVIVIDALASPRQGEQLVQAIRTVTRNRSRGWC